MGGGFVDDIERHTPRQGPNKLVDLTSSMPPAGWIRLSSRIEPPPTPRVANQWFESWKTLNLYHQSNVLVVLHGCVDVGVSILLLHTRLIALSDLYNRCEWPLYSIWIQSFWGTLGGTETHKRHDRHKKEIERKSGNRQNPWSCLSMFYPLLVGFVLPHCSGWLGGGTTRSEPILRVLGCSSPHQRLAGMTPQGIYI